MKLLLVDDEDFTREGLFHHVNWDALGIHHVKSASNGMQALEIAQTFLPDILLTDIRMPHMNGIELAKEIRKRSSSCKILFISGYAEKEYFKSAIDLKVEAYIDKPATPDNVSQVLSQVTAAIFAEKDRMEKENKMMQNLQRTEDIVRSRIAAMLIHPKTDWNEFHKNFCPAYFHWTDGNWCQVICLRSGFNSSTALIDSDVDLIQQYWNEITPFDMEQYYAGIAENCCLYLIIQTEKRHLLVQTLQNLIEKLNTHLQKRFYMAVGHPVFTPREIPKSFSSALLCLNCACFYQHENSFTLCQETFSPKEIAIDSMRKFTMDLHHFQDLLTLIKKEEYTNIEQIRYFFYEFYLQHAHKLTPLNLCSWETFSAFSFMEYVSLFTAPSEDALLEQTRQNYDPKIRSAIQYISENYGNEKLSIRMIAEHVDLSPNYFSTYFKQHTNITVNDFIIHVRIEHAKHLLRTTNLKLYEISQNIGIPDANYLNILFKKICHTTPSQYRKEL